MTASNTIAAGSPARLGASWDGRGTNFALFSANAEKVELCLFDEHDHEARVQLTSGARSFRTLRRRAKHEVPDFEAALATDVQAASLAHYADSPYFGHMQEMIIAHGIGVGYIAKRHCAFNTLNIQFAWASTSCDYKLVVAIFVNRAGC